MLMMREAVVRSSSSSALVFLPQRSDVRSSVNTVPVALATSHSRPDR